MPIEKLDSIRNPLLSRPVNLDSLDQLVAKREAAMRQQRTVRIRREPVPQLAIPEPEPVQCDTVFPLQVYAASHPVAVLDGRGYVALRLSDSLPKLIALPKPVVQVAPFKGGEIPLAHHGVLTVQPLQDKGEPLMLQRVDMVFGLGFLVVYALLTAVARIYFRETTRKYVGLLFRRRSVESLETVSALNVLGFNLLADLLYCLVLGYLGWLLLPLGSVEWLEGVPPYGVVAILTGLIFTRYLLQGVVIFTSGWLTNRASGAYTVWRQLQFINRLAWLPLFVLAIPLTFLSTGVWGAALRMGVLLLLGAVLLYRVLRVAVVFARYRFGAFYYFLYLCALELTPLLFILRLLGQL